MLVRRCNAIARSSGCDAAVPEVTEPFDLAPHDVARLEKARRLAAGADARRRAREDDVPGEERQDRRELADDPWHREHHVRRAAVLHELVVHPATEREVVAVRELIGRDQAGTDRTE